MKKLFILTIFGLMLSVSSFALDPIVGSMRTCVGYFTYLSDSLSPGGTWSSSNVAIATIDISSGATYGVSAGVCTITYTLSASYVTTSFTVTPAPAAITGPSTVCVGATITLADAVGGGIWNSSSTARATVTSGGGVVTGVSAGTVNIYYTMPGGCMVYTTVTVNGTPVSPISGASSVCVGSTVTLSDLTSGGTWSSSSTSIATIDASTGVVTGVASGGVTITYSVSGACGTTSVYHTMTVGTTSAGTISGPSSVYTGSSISLTDPVSGGTWSSSNTAIATVTSSGIVTGVSAGTVTITYTVSGCGGTASTTKTITVSTAPPVNRISGHINFSGAPLDTIDMIRVWLITYNPSTHILEATDSTYTFSGGSSAYYQFMSKPTDSYRVKAAVYPAVFSSTGYTPTYHTSSNYWSSANVLYHTGGTDDGVDINMGYGSVTAGAGFIGGDVTTGANRGTSGTIPAVGLLIYAKSATGSIMQYTYTDAAGHYSFNNLPIGDTYTIYPEAINYATIPYTSISLTSAHPSMTAASFIQHTISYTITPNTTGIANAVPAMSSVVAFPNPTSGTLNILWNEIATENGNLSISDITGREVYHTSINMTAGSGAKQVDLSGLINGNYIVTIKSGTINYNNKVQITH